VYVAIFSGNYRCIFQKKSEGMLKICLLNLGRSDRSVRSCFNSHSVLILTLLFPHSSDHFQLKAQLFMMMFASSRIPAGRKQAIRVARQI
jgi:hypothetical protein